MSVKMSELGLKRRLNDGLANLGAGNGKVGLFTNNHTPAETDTIGAYTEPGESWYAQIGLGAWPAATMVAGKASSTQDPVAFISDSAVHVTIYGYFVVDAAGVLQWAELDAAGPFTMDRSGAEYQVTVNCTEDNA